MLKKHQILAISRRVKYKKFNNFSLESELVDFVACEIETRLQQRGGEFEELLEEVMNELEIQELSKLQRISAVKSKPNSIDMLQNYLKIAARNFAKHRANSIVNVVGLLMAISSVLVIGLYVNSEFSYDKSFPDQELIFQGQWYFLHGRFSAPL